MFKIFIFVLLGTLLCYSWSISSSSSQTEHPIYQSTQGRFSGCSSNNTIASTCNSSSNKNSVHDEKRNSDVIYVTPVLEYVLEAHNLDSAVVGNLMEQHGLDEASLLQLLADVGQTAALVLDSESD